MIKRGIIYIAELEIKELASFFSFLYLKGGIAMGDC